MNSASLIFTQPLSYLAIRRDGMEFCTNLHSHAGVRKTNCLTMSALQTRPYASWCMLVIGFTFMLLGCQKAEQTETLISDKQLDSQPGLVLAVPPYEMPSQIQLRFEPLVAYLSQILNQPVHLHITHSYEEQIKRLVLGEIDIAYMGPSTYIKARDNFQTQHPESIKLIVAEAPYRAAIIVHQDSDISQIDQLKHHSFAFGSYHSYSGHFVVRQLLRLEQIFLSDLQFYSFLGRHERAIMSVVHKNFDAAATTEGLAQRFIDLGQPIRILHTSEFLAPTVLVARAGLDPFIIDQLRDALLLPDPTQIPDDFSQHFYEVDDYDFLEAKRILNLIER